MSVCSIDKPGSGLGYDFVGELERVRGALLRYAHRLTGSEAARDDLVQDTLLRAWVARDRFTAGTSFKGWLFRIARNTFLSGLRRHRRQIDLPDEDISRLLTVPAEQETQVHLADLQSAIAQLPAAQAEALLAVQAAEDQYEQVAERLGIAPGTLRSRVHRARLKIAVAIDGSSAKGKTTPEIANDVDDVGVVIHPSSSRRNVYAAWKASGSRMIG